MSLVIRSTSISRWWARLAQAVYAACLLGLLLLPTQRYGWMRELDPGFGGPLPEDGAGNRFVAAAVLLALALLAQLAAGWLGAAARARQRWIAAVPALLLAGLAVVVWALRFGGA